MSSPLEVCKDFTLWPHFAPRKIPIHRWIYIIRLSQFKGQGSLDIKRSYCPIYSLLSKSVVDALASSLIGIKVIRLYNPDFPN